MKEVVVHVQTPCMLDSRQSCSMIKGCRVLQKGLTFVIDMLLLLLQVYLQLQEPQIGQMKALKSNLEKARELKNAQSNGSAQGGADKGQQQMIMELYQKCAQLKVDHRH